MSAAGQILYLKIEQNCIVYKRSVTLQDIASVECTDVGILRQVLQEQVYYFSGNEKSSIIVGNIGKCFFCGVQRLVVTGQNHTVDIIPVGDKTVNVVGNVRILWKLLAGGTAGKNLLDFAVEDHILG